MDDFGYAFETDVDSSVFTDDDRRMLKETHAAIKAIEAMVAEAIPALASNPILKMFTRGK